MPTLLEAAGAEGQVYRRRGRMPVAAGVLKTDGQRLLE